MNIEEQVLSIEQMQHLKELGLEVKDTAVVLDTWDDPNLANTYFEEDLKERTPTLTFQEIFELLPDHIVVDNSYYELIINKNECWIAYLNFDSKEPFKIYHFMGNKLKALYKMLCWVIENNYNR